MFHIIETDHRDRLIAHGVGISYAYDPENAYLNISSRETGDEIAGVHCPNRIQSHHPEIFLTHLERSSNIKSLILSDNKTINLFEAIAPERIKPLFQSVFDASVNSFDLDNEEFSMFTDAVQIQYKLEEMQIKRMHCNHSGSYYYRSFLKTCSGHDIVTRSYELYDLIHKVSGQIVQDVIPREYGKKNNVTANNLLLLSSKMSILSRILNKNFNPYLQIEKNFSKKSEENSSL